MHERQGTFYTTAFRNNNNILNAAGANSLVFTYKIDVSC